MTRAALMLPLLLWTSTAEARWRGAVDLGIGGYRSTEAGGARIGAAGLVLATYLERSLRERPLAIRGTLTVDIFGPLVVGVGGAAVAVPDSSIVGAHLHVGPAWSVRRRWTLAAALGVGRTLYTSPMLRGDSGLVPSIAGAAEWFAASPTPGWRLGLNARLTLDFDAEPAGTRVAAAVTLGVVMAIGSRRP